MSEILYQFSAAYGLSKSRFKAEPCRVQWSSAFRVFASRVGAWSLGIPPKP